MEVQTTISSYAAMQIFTGTESARGKLNYDGTISSCLVFMRQALAILLGPIGKLGEVKTCLSF
jgi:hypothetical protein